MEYFEIAFPFDGAVWKGLVVKLQTPEEIIFFVHIDGDITPLQNPQRFSFVDGAFNEALPDDLAGTAELRTAIWQEIYLQKGPVL